MTPEELEVQREQDRVYAFCEHGLGHDEIMMDRADPSVGIFGDHVWCDRCGTDLSNDELLNPTPEEY